MKSSTSAWKMKQSPALEWTPDAVTPKPYYVVRAPVPQEYAKTTLDEAWEAIE